MDPFDPANELIDPFAIAMQQPEPEFPATDDFVAGVEQDIANEQAAAQPLEGEASQDEPWAWAPQDWRPAEAAKNSVESYIAENYGGQPQQAPESMPSMEFGVDEGMVIENGQATMPGQQPQQAMAPDVVSGGDSLAPLTPEEPDPEWFGEFKPSVDPYSLEGRLETYEGMSPEQREIAFAREDMDLANWRREQVAKVNEQNRREFERIEAMARQARQESAQEAAALSEQIERMSAEELDPGRYGRSNSTLGNIALVIGAALGGYLNVRHGTRNQALDFINAEIEQDLANQKADRAKNLDLLGRKASMLDRSRQLAADEMQAEHAFRLARWQQAIQQIDEQVQQFDPEGTAARNLLQLRQVAAAKAAEQRMALEKEGFDRRMRVVEQERKNAETQSKLQLDSLDAEAKAMENAKMARRGTGGGKTEDAAWQPSQLAAYYGGPTPPQPMNQKEYRDWLGVRGKAAEVDEKVASRYVFDKNGRPLTNPNGQTFLPPTAEEAKDIRKGQEQLQNLQRGVDLLVDMRRKYGGASKWAGTDEWQQFTSITRDLDLEAGKRYGLGALSKDDIQNVIDIRGGVDPASFIKDPIPGLQTMAKRATEKFNEQLFSAGYRGEKWEPKKSRNAALEGKSGKEIISEVVAPVPPHHRDNFRGLLTQRAADMGVWLRQEQPSVGEMRKVAREIGEAEQEGRISRDLAEELVATMRPRFTKLSASKNPNKSRPSADDGSVAGYQREKSRRKAEAAEEAESGQSFMSDPREFYLMMTGGE